MDGVTYLITFPLTVDLTVFYTHHLDEYRGHQGVPQLQQVQVTYVHVASAANPSSSFWHPARPAAHTLTDRDT